MHPDTSMIISQPQTLCKASARHVSGLAALILMVEAGLVACAFLVVDHLLGGHAVSRAGLDLNQSCLMAAVVFFALKWIAVGRELDGIAEFSSSIQGSAIALLGTTIVVVAASSAGLTVARSGAAAVLTLSLATPILALFDELVGRHLRLRQGHGASLRARSVALLGEPEACHVVADCLATGEPRIRVVGAFAATDVATNACRSTNHEFEQLLALVRSRSVDEVVLALNGLNDRLLAPCVDQLIAYPVTISLAPGSLGGSVSGISHLGSLPSLPMIRRPMGQRAAVAKRAMDVMLAAIGLVWLAPLLALTALAIRIDSRGPIFFRQLRTGYNQESFMVWKFRTMRCGDADEAAFRQASRGDERVTRIGRVLRRLSVDELPQLINVLLGDMSLVGPRPHPLPLNNRFGDQLPLYAARHRVLPGITGLAQINGCRGETDALEKMATRLEYDLIYIRNWSLWLDLKILLMTLTGKFLHPNAY